MEGSHGERAGIKAFLGDGCELQLETPPAVRRKPWQRVSDSSRWCWI